MHSRHKRKKGEEGTPTTFHCRHVSTLTLHRVILHLLAVGRYSELFPPTRRSFHYAFSPLQEILKLHLTLVWHACMSK